MARVTPSGIRDNHHRGSVGAFLQEKIVAGSTLSVVSAYFTIYAFEMLKTQLEGIASMRFLFGEPRFLRSLDPDRTDKKVFNIEDDGLRLQNRLTQKRVARECANWLMSKVEVRSVKRSNFLHGKMYHIAHGRGEDAILGSSNFTVRGLGLGVNGNNIELNLEVDGNRDRQDLHSWFDELWQDKALVEDVKDEVLHYLSQLYQNHSPEFIYYKTLFHLFEQFLQEQAKGGLLQEEHQLVDTAIWRSLFPFQRDGVKGAIHKIDKHNGCIIADSVGLGKTYEALAIIKYYELRNYRVLVLCPKKLRENWTIYQAHTGSALNPFLTDRFSYTVLSHTDLSRDSGMTGDINLGTLNWGSFDLLVIDESHNFRNNTRGQRDEDGNIIRKSRYERLMDDIIATGVKTKVLLLSATPVNNDLKDLRNQLAFITEGHDDAFAESLGIASVRDTLATAQRSFTEWVGVKTERRTGDLLERLSSAFFKLLDELTIARSRKHIQRYYADSIADLGGFPKRLPPLSIVPDIDRLGRFMAYDKLNDQISDYQLSLFHPSLYILPEYHANYSGSSVRNFTQDQRERFLIGMMKVNFLKRLESSVSSFAITMERTIAKIEHLQDRIRRFQQFQELNPNIDLADYQLEDSDDEELQEALQVGGKLQFQMAHLDVQRWMRDLERDRRQLTALYVAAKDISVERDAKLYELKQTIAAKVREPSRTKQGLDNRKVLVFTAFADTAIYLYDALQAWAHDELGINCALVTGAGGNRTTFGGTEFNHILTNFSPISKRRAHIPTLPQNGEIDLLIATDCISEGQNLQDCDMLINYDIHWNPVRIIQRFGRIDRIGSINSAVQLINFWPTADLNKYINLKNRVEARMALVDIAATFEDNLLATDVEELVTDELKYRDRQLLRLREEVLDLEDFKETVSLDEFTLDDFRIELTRYLERNQRLLRDAPLGLYAVVPPDPAYPLIRPGVIWCLRQKGDTQGNEVVNPLQPYFLIYVREEGEVRFSFAQPKQILELYRVLCAARVEPYEQLCDIFDNRTNDGLEMTLYDDLLQKAVASIVSSFKHRAVSHLLSGRAGRLIERAKQASAPSDFELITWLVIQA